MGGLKLHCFYFEAHLFSQCTQSCTSTEHVKCVWLTTCLPSLSPLKNAKMSAHAKKRKVDAESRTFKQIWTTNFFFTEVKGKPVCLVSGEHVAVFKGYNSKRPYETKHAEKYKNLTDAERARTSTDLLTKARKTTRLFYKAACSQRCSEPEPALW